MGILSDILAWQATNVFCDPDRTLAEPITYTSIVANVAQAPVSLTVPIDRTQPVIVGQENSRVRTKQIRLLIPAGSVAGVARGDQLTAPWEFGTAARPFRVTKIENADAGAWEITAEASVN